MWVFTLDGFFSAVAHTEDSAMLLIRARDEGDIKRLRDALLDYDTVPDIEHTPNADYAWRMVVPREVFGVYLQDTANELVYPNFKQAVHDRYGYARAHLYGRVWLTMLGLQHEQ
jgi:hypothetical protein